MARVLALLLALLSIAAAPARAADELVTIATRPGVTVSYWLMPRADAPATLLLLPGGGGSLLMRDGQPQSGNFLVRSRELFREQGFAVAIAGPPSDVAELSYTFRASSAHVEDLRQVVDDLQRRSGKPVWLIGTSRGTISAAAAAIALGPERIAGLVLSSSITSPRHPDAVTKLALEKIRVPVFVLHHAQDACVACPPREVPRILQGLGNAPVKQLQWAEGGGPPQGDPCGPFHWHGYIGIEPQAVAWITQWIRDPQR